MNISELNHKRLCILGFGREGKATLDALRRFKIDCEITIADRSEVAADGCDVQSGNDYLQDLGRFDIIVKSPGIAWTPELESLRDKITSATQIFFESVTAKGATIIGITGSKGKSTTSSLIYEVLKAAGKNVSLVGNIGQPSLDYLEMAASDTIFVYEASSYQLADLTVSPPIAVLTSFFPDHLDYHGSLEHYWEAKSRIARFQTDKDVVFYPEQSPECLDIANLSPGLHVSFSIQDAPITIEETHLVGAHNLSNIAAAYKVACFFDVPLEICLGVFKEFRGLPHRLESLGMYHGIEWVDDAISTTPDSTIAGLDALGDRVTTIILGGLDRGYEFDELGQRVVNSNIQTVILFPGTGPLIRDAIMSANIDQRSIAFYDASDMPTVVRLAKIHTLPNSICLLSTASPSYNLFKNFEEKGNEFAKYIKMT